MGRLMIHNSNALKKLHAPKNETKMRSACGEFYLLGKVAQLGQCCDNAEEAKSLIPSLQNKISDGDLQELLDELTKQKTPCS
jgi:hypothetical protein